jgi:hypothetical protein
MMVKIRTGQMTKFGLYVEERPAAVRVEQWEKALLALGA